MRVYRVPCAWWRASLSCSLEQAGCLVRVLTTARFLGSDPAAMSNHAVGLLGCSFLLLQRAYFDERGPTRLQTRRA